MYDFETARQRDGEAGGRPDHVDEVISRPRLGHGNGDPLVGESYDEFPEQRSDLTTPEAREFVTNLFDHDLVNSIDDAISETTPAVDRHTAKKWSDAFERATDLFDVEITEGDDETEQRATDRLAELASEFPEDIRDPSNPLVVAHLYAELGLSTEEITDLFEDTDPSQIRRTLRNAGLIEGEKSEGTPFDELLVNPEDPTDE